MNTQTITRRERVRLALNHQEPDRVPIDITWTKVPYLGVRQQLGLPQEDVKPDVWDRVRPAIDVTEKLHCDFIWVGLKGPSTRRKFSFDLDSYSDEWGVTFCKVQRPDGGYQFEIRGSPLPTPTLEALERFPWPDPLDPARYEGVGDAVRHVYETTDYALCARLGDNVWEQANYSSGQANWLTLLVTHPDYCVALMQRIAKIQKAVYLEGLEHIGKYLSLIRLGGEDFGTQGGLLISPRMFRTMIKPILKDIYLAVKERLADMGNYDCKLMLHSCGGIEPLIDDFIEIGVDVLDPVQTRAKNMNALHLKQKYGDRISFHGGIDTQGILPFGSPEDVAEETRRKLQSFAPGGGYILCPTHNLQADVKAENIIAMVETGIQSGSYPLAQTYDSEFLLALDH
jgi:uroporphyrinogen decarboxylase